MAESGNEIRSINSQTNDGSSHFAGAHNFTIQNQFNVAPDGKVIINVNNRQSIKELLEPLLDATHRRDRRRFPPNSVCLPGTRDDVIKQIKTWANNGIIFKDDVSHVLWLYGYVGSGKSAIAQTIAETFAKKGRLAASFFFFRGSGDRSKSARFVKTLASELASAIPATAPWMKKAIEEYAGLLTTSPLELQFQHLYLEPFRATLRNPGRLAQRLLTGPVVTVIDGLDECEDREEVASFMDRMAEFYREYPRTPLRFFISSRVEEHIRTHITNIGQHTQIQVVDLAQYGSQDDIALIVNETFKKAAQEDRVIRSYGNWPNAEDRQTLINHADGSFILISTILRFILETTDDGRTSKERLEVALNVRTGLDEMYTQILTRAEMVPYFTDILSSIILVQAPLSTYQLADLHHVECGRVIPVLVNLHSVLQVPGDDADPVTLCHSSFREYLCSRSRSGRFFVEPSGHGFLARRCLEHLILSPAEPDVNSFAVYGNNSVAFHWRKNVAARRGNPVDIRSELRGLIEHASSVWSPSFGPYIYYALVNYTLMERQWVKAISTRNSMISVSSFVARFTGIPIYQDGLWHPITAILEVVDHTITTLLEETQDDDLEAELGVLWEAMDPPAPNFVELLPLHTRTLFRCISHLFASCPPPSYGSPTSPEQFEIPIVLLPVKGNDLDISDYAFWNFGLHLEMALIEDRGFTLESLLCQRDPPRPWSHPQREHISPFHYMVHQSRYLGKSDTVGHSTRLKSKLEVVSSIITSLLEMDDESEPLASIDDWCFVKPPGNRCDDLVFGCVRDNYSVYNMWLGYSIVAQCFLSGIEETHDDETCTMHQKLQQVKKTVITEA